MSNLKPQLATILSATEPVQTFLNMPFNEKRDQLELAKYLPAPLFTLFSETRAYSQACGKHFDIFFPILLVKKSVQSQASIGPTILNANYFEGLFGKLIVDYLTEFQLRHL